MDAEPTHDAVVAYEDPRNSSLSRRIFSIGAVTMLAFVGTFGGAIYAPAQEEISRLFDCNSEVALLPLSMYNLGMAFGPLFGAPLSEFYGRKTVFLITTPIFALFVLGAGFSNGITALTICRFFAGFFAAPLVSNASATIMDFTVGVHRGISLGLYYTVPFAAVTIGSLSGGFLLQSKGWRWTQWLTVMAAVVLYIPILFTRETYKKVLARRLAASTRSRDLETAQSSVLHVIHHFATTLLFRPMHMLFSEPIVALVSLFNAFIFALLYTFVVSVPWSFGAYYQFDTTQQSLSFLGLLIGTISAPIPLLFIDLRYYQKKLQEWQRSHSPDDGLPPEHRLAAALLGSLLLPSSLFIVAWTTQQRLHWSIPIVFQGVTMLSSLLIYASVSLFMLDAYGPLYGASASGAMMFARYFGGTASPLYAQRLYTSIGVGWATTILACLSLALAPVPWLFWKHGARLRERSKYETST